MSSLIHFFVFSSPVSFVHFVYYILSCFLLGASAGQPLSFPLNGGSSDVIQSQQQCIKFTVAHRTHCRDHTYVLICVI